MAGRVIDLGRHCFLAGKILKHIIHLGRMLKPVLPIAEAFPSTLRSALISPIRRVLSDTEKYPGLASGVWCLRF